MRTPSLVCDHSHSQAAGPELVLRVIRAGIPAMAFRKFHPAILAATIAFLWSFSPGFAEESSLDATTLLRAGDYKKLDSYFSARQREFDAGKVSGDQLRDAFR